MKLKRAYDILIINNDHNPNITDAERREAHQLGIEAIDAVIDARANNYWTPIPPLPSETPEGDSPPT